MKTSKVQQLALTWSRSTTEFEPCVVSAGPQCYISTISSTFLRQSYGSSPPDHSKSVRVRLSIFFNFSLAMASLEHFSFSHLSQW